ncbi:hypothetical protein Pmar_PMAR003710 [Perkinsus marinus ATCC 50983]|uniref:Uncharacterized protein n=1 Tax=Perkinsus marinus (strain ATCC 50983 / TXsc) TaxID=423536 RepID=C5KI35_PERM5|nr:hypothetical protein Pmar_PMAR003710 [Perkinsus marinus ATCC 50983]EER16247.1 hypothetical protein Pmar_PMAR003710 [Perkinsus marinus ATCC 50983]|eukprot:XP_002784451.1 hypothetical protein Pmar_PMAR003710 [Perkinsus marinus ATCC 50983]
MTEPIKESFDAIMPFFQEFDDGEEFEDLKEMEAFVDQQIALLQMQSAMAETDYPWAAETSSMASKKRIRVKK